MRVPSVRFKPDEGRVTSDGSVRGFRAVLGEYWEEEAESCDGTKQQAETMIFVFTTPARS